MAFYQLELDSLTANDTQDLWSDDELSLNVEGNVKESGSWEGSIGQNETIYFDSLNTATVRYDDQINVSLNEDDFGLGANDYLDTKTISPSDPALQYDGTNEYTFSGDGFEYTLDVSL